ncbi:MAG TPA: hypothetical protein VGT44_07590, partial [Ktedonobacteraceae bacterium]|nr:hypothetical protein [Ktedonobacteraceae bacterium]
GKVVFDGYMAALMLAKAREDRPALDIAASVLDRMLPDDADTKDFLTAMRNDDLGKLNMDNVNAGVTGLILSWFSEANLAAPPRLMQISVFQNDMTTWCVNIAQAILEDDNEQLAHAIDEAEAHHLVVHAARMRVVLAQRTHDRAQMERARLVLERLQDRRFLNRLQEVEEAR